MFDNSVASASAWCALTEALEMMLSKSHYSLDLTGPHTLASIEAVVEPQMILPTLCTLFAYQLQVSDNIFDNNVVPCFDLIRVWQFSLLCCIEESDVLFSTHHKMDTVLV